MTRETSLGQSGKNQPIQAYQSIPYVDDEIDLRDVFATLWRRRKFICIGVLLFVLSAAAIVFTIPDVYRIKALMSPGVISRQPGEDVVFTSSLESVKGQIQANAYETRLKMLLDNRFEDVTLSSKKLRVSIPKNSSALLLSYDTINQDFGKAVLSHLITLLKQEDSGIIHSYVEGVELHALSDKKAILEYEQKIGLTLSHLKDLYLSKRRVEKQIGNAIKSIELNMNGGIKKLASSGSSQDSLYKALLYTNMVIQNRQVLSDSNKELSENNAQIVLFEEKRQSDVVSMRELRLTVNESSRIVKNIKPFQEIAPVMVEEGRVGPKRGLIIVMSFICGVFFMTLSAFVVEYIKPSN